MGNRRRKKVFEHTSVRKRKRNKHAVAYGHITNEIGKALELRVVKALNCNKPSGWKSVRKGTEKEDADGFDVVIEMDAGWLGIQIKSSENGKEAFLRDHGKPSIPVVIIGMADSDEEIRAKVRKEMNVLFFPCVAWGTR